MTRPKASDTNAVRASAADRARQDQAVDVPAFIAGLAHPHEAEILALRMIILSVDRRIGETIKWNAPSFHTTTDFATFHLRSKTGILVVLHHGAKASRDAKAFVIDDPTGMLAWRGTDRAIVTFADADDIAARRAAFIRVLKQWVKQV